MQEVLFRKTSVSWPQVCACCLAPMTHTVASSRTKKLFLGIATVSRTFSVDVPYCAACTQHVLWKANGGMSGVVTRAAAIAFFGTFAGMLLTLLCTQVVPAILNEIAPRYGSLNGAPPIVGFILAPLFSCVAPLVIAAVYVRRKLKARPAAPAEGAHASDGPAVELRDFDAESLTLSVHNDRYAELLKGANP